MGEITLRNDSRETIRHAHIEIGSEALDMEAIKPGETRSGSFKIDGDAHFTITVEFLNGGRLVREIGYVTSGFDFQHIITVSENDISISDAEIK